MDHLLAYTRTVKGHDIRNRPLPVCLKKSMTKGYVGAQVPRPFEHIVTEEISIEPFLRRWPDVKTTYT